jgi:excisionase family DNA binding protein
MESILIERIENWGRGITVAELTELLPVSEKTLRRAIKAHRLPAFRMKGKVFLDPRLTAQWLRSILS